MKDHKFDVSFVFSLSPITAAIPAIIQLKTTKGHIKIITGKVTNKKTITPSIAFILLSYIKLDK